MQLVVLDASMIRHLIVIILNLPGRIYSFTVVVSETNSTWLKIWTRNCWLDPMAMKTILEKLLAPGRRGTGPVFIRLVDPCRSSSPWMRPTTRSRATCLRIAR